MLLILKHVININFTIRLCKHITLIVSYGKEANTSAVSPLCSFKIKSWLSITKAKTQPNITIKVKTLPPRKIHKTDSRKAKVAWDWRTLAQAAVSRIDAIISVEVFTVYVDKLTCTAKDI